jgi:hypothetical protein
MGSTVTLAETPAATFSSASASAFRRAFSRRIVSEMSVINAGTYLNGL